MAELLWGQVYFHGTYAGILREEPGHRCSFTYDPAYLATAASSPIAWTLPLQAQPHLAQQGLHPFFDNLVAEGWLEEAQTRLLGKRQASRFELLLAFGRDCAGAVSLEDPSPAALVPANLDRDDARQVALLKSRASLSGIQPKFTLVREKGKFRPARSGETSTHIAKFPSRRHDDLVITEFLTMQAFAALLPGDPIAECRIGQVAGSPEPALIITRFDRTPDGQRLHFEEFNQLLGRTSAAKYEGAHKEMADFIRTTPGCLPAENYRLFLRILAGLLLGNTDMHFKNFAMLHTPQGLRLAPSYDQVAAALYGYKSLALAIGNAPSLSWCALKAKSLVRLGEEFGFAAPVIAMAAEQLAKRKDAALEAVAQQDVGTKKTRDTLINLVKKRWNGTFNLLGPALSKKR